MPVNYDNIAGRYDTVRPSGADFCFGRLAEALRGAGCVLEIGAGTGNTTRFIAPKIRGLLAALEPSPGMIARAREKGTGGLWLRGRAPGLPFGPACFDAVYSTYVMQHVPDLPGFFADCARVLRGGGVTAHITVPPSYIAEHPLNLYFPSFAAIDLGRFPPLETLGGLLEQAGFEGVRWDIEQDQPKPMDRTYLARVEAKFLSTFDLMDPEEYAEGLARLRRDVEAGGGEAGPLITREVALVRAGLAP